MFTINYGQQVWGSIDINTPISIISSNNELTFAIDGKTYTLTIPVGTYKTVREQHSSELVSILNTLANDVNAPVEFKLGGMHYDQKYNVVVIEHNDKSVGHVIDGFGGTAKDLIFGETKFNLSPRD
ncbi:hypothetical protein MHB54_00290 [Paenibacillus sp. FSL M7-0802]|jgi:hypothetical protein|uniref:hypothetical protein n=1 Tax=Paenibacillus sp. FSL M7-0802 TaxID=2921536 RepID=UPI0030F748BF